MDANLPELEQFLRSVRGYECDVETARMYGHNKTQLRVKGRPIPEADIWIAATAQQHGLTLVTRHSDFAHVDGRSVERW